MGIFDFMFKDDLNSNVTNVKKKKSGIFDFMFKEEKEDEVSFADSEAVEDINETIPGKIQEKKIELKTFGLVLNSINPEEFSGASAIIKEYLDLLEGLKELGGLAEKSSQEDIMSKIELETKYSEFERKYEEQIPLIKNLYWLSEIKKQNNNMQIDFNKPINEISKSKLDDYYRYIKTISSQKENFSEQYQNQLVEEMIIAEYRLKMLIMMRKIYFGEKIENNLFEKASDSKKKRWQEMFLEDMEKASEQYQSIVNLKRLYIKSNVLKTKDFEALERLSDKVLNNINQDVIDDFSISEIFTQKGISTLEDFLELKASLNEMKARFNDIEPESFKRKKHEFDDDWEV